MNTGQKILSQLQGLEDNGNGRYRSHSPLRAGSDSPSFSLYIAPDGEHGMFKDFVSDEAGSLYDLARHMQIELPTIQAETGKRGYKDLAEYAESHGVEAEVFRAAKWREGVLGERPVLFFDTSQGQRWRFMDGRKPKYGNKKGYQTCWYGLKRAVTLAIKSGVFILCNGEASTVVAQHYGLGAACLTNSGERSDLTDKLLHELKESLGDQPPEILIAYDCDKKGRQAAPLMAAYLTANGLPARAVDLKMGIAGGDLADFCQLHGDETLARLQALGQVEAQPAEDNGYKWKIVKRDYARSLPLVKWLIEDEIQDRAVNVLIGAPGVGKSFMAINYAGQISKTDPVVYMIGEGDLGINPRLTAWEEHHKHLTDENLYLCFGAVEIMQQDELNAFIEDMRPLKPKLVIVDTLARAMLTGDENSSRDMKLFINGCTQIVKELDCAVLLVHHTRKDGESYRGSSVLAGNVDVLMTASMQDEVIQLKSDKFKEKAASHGKYFRLLPKQLTIHDEAVESAVIIPDEQYEPGDRLSQSQMAILKLLAEDEDETYYRRDLVETLSLPLGTVQNAVKVLQKKGFVSKGSKTQPYEITDEGKAFVAGDEKSEPLKPSEPTPSQKAHQHQPPKTDGSSGSNGSNPPDLPISPVNSPPSAPQTTKSEPSQHPKTDGSNPPDLPPYRVLVEHINFEDNFKTTYHIGISQQKPIGWEDRKQLSPERYAELISKGLPVKPIRDCRPHADGKPDLLRSRPKS